MSLSETSPPRTLPLAGTRVVEFTHMVMGPTCGEPKGCARCRYSQPASI